MDLRVPRTWGRRTKEVEAMRVTNVGFARPVRCFFRKTRLLRLESESGRVVNVYDNARVLEAAEVGSQMRVTLGRACETDIHLHGVFRTIITDIQIAA